MFKKKIKIGKKKEKKKKSPIQSHILSVTVQKPGSYTGI